MDVTSVPACERVDISGDGMPLTESLFVVLWSCWMGEMEGQSNMVLGEEIFRGCGMVVMRYRENATRDIMSLPLLVASPVHPSPHATGVDY